MKQQLSHQKIREIETQCEQMRSEAIFNSFASLFIGLKTKFVEMVNTSSTGLIKTPSFSPKFLFSSANIYINGAIKN